MKDAEPMPKSERGNPRLQRLVLRIISAVSFIALPAIFAPQMAVEKFSVLLGFGKPPHLPLLIYMTSGASCVYLAQAVLLWLMSCDVVRYRPLIVFCGWAYLAFGRRRLLELPCRWSSPACGLLFWRPAEQFKSPPCLTFTKCRNLSDLGIALFRSLPALRWDSKPHLHADAEAAAGHRSHVFAEGGEGTEPGEPYELSGRGTKRIYRRL
jgi:hypothetical protein